MGSGAKRIRGVHGGVLYKRRTMCVVNDNPRIPMSGGKKYKRIGGKSRFLIVPPRCRILGCAAKSTSMSLTTSEPSMLPRTLEAQPSFTLGAHILDERHTSVD